MVLRGSKRATQSALQVITAAGHGYRAVLTRRGVADQDMMAAAVAFLHEMPLEGKLVSLDAGLLQRPVVKTVVQKGGLPGADQGQSGRTVRGCERLARGLWW